jgi:Fic family protein
MPLHASHLFGVPVVLPYRPLHVAKEFVGAAAGDPFVSGYAPPYTLSEQAVAQVAHIGEKVGRLSVIRERLGLRLRRANRIRTIQGSLAIEGNTLSEEQITAVLEGKPVIAPPVEVQEVRNALKAYDRMPTWNPTREADLLEAHRILMAGLIDQPGVYRRKAAGVMGKQGIVHVAPPADLVTPQMRDLLEWLSVTEAHPLVASSVFHYEFEFIHPFEDGNGRMGRLWQSLLLSRWNPLFADLPVESLIHAHQADYYAALNTSTRKGNCTAFIEFMLDIIDETLETPQVALQDAPQVTPHVGKLLQVLDGAMDRDHLQGALGLKARKNFRLLYLVPALEEGFIEMTLPDKPNSRLQRYRLTVKGQAVRNENQARMDALRRSSGQADEQG